MTKWLWRFWLFNPLALRTQARRLHLWQVAPALDVVLLPGTQVQALDTGEANFTSFTGGRTLVGFGWEHGPFTNKPCGTAIGLGKYLGQQNSKQVWLPPTGFRGRGGAIRLKAGRLDVFLTVLCYPPPASLAKQKPVWLKTINRLTGWLDNVLNELPCRCTRVIGKDLNPAVGFQGPDPVHNGTLGDHGRAPET